MFLYEEFMARSSTRQALRKGGNFVGMMGVLMQLRKVCNHPDLFEPRSVVTPFVVDSLQLRTACCILNLLEPETFCETVRLTAFADLWTAASGDVSGVVDCMEHDSVRAEQLHRLEPSDSLFNEKIENIEVDEPLPVSGTDPGLAKQLRDVWMSVRQGREGKVTSRSGASKRFSIGSRRHRDCKERGSHIYTSRASCVEKVAAGAN